MQEISWGRILSLTFTLSGLFFPVIGVVIGIYFCWKRGANAKKGKYILLSGILGALGGFCIVIPTREFTSQHFDFLTYVFSKGFLQYCGFFSLLFGTLSAYITYRCFRAAERSKNGTNTRNTFITGTKSISTSSAVSNLCFPNPCIHFPCLFLKNRGYYRD